MRTELFDFHLPPELIAQHPARPPDAARLLVVDPAGLQDRRVLDLPDLLEPADLLVLNNTRVLPSRLVGRRVTCRHGSGRWGFERAAAVGIVRGGRNHPSVRMWRGQHD